MPKPACNHPISASKFSHEVHILISFLHVQFISRCGLSMRACCDFCRLLYANQVVHNNVWQLELLSVKDEHLSSSRCHVEILFL